MYIQGSIRILSVQLQKFSQSEHTPITSIQVKKQKITSLGGTLSPLLLHHPPLPRTQGRPLSRLLTARVGLAHSGTFCERTHLLGSVCT